jgi:dienelactone hydrolase
MNGMVRPFKTGFNGVYALYRVLATANYRLFWALLLLLEGWPGLVSQNIPSRYNERKGAPMKRLTFLLILCLLTACGGGAPPAGVTATAKTLPPPAVRTARVPTITLEPTSTAFALPTPDQYQEYTISALRARAYGGGTLEVLDTMGDGDVFTRYALRYPSDGLNIYGFMNVPKGPGPFPVLIMLHGYVDPAIYQTLDYTTDAADGMTSEGYLVLHPNLRNYKPSDSGDNLFRVGLAVDVLNLIALVKAQGGQPGPLEKADPSRIGLWGHSMGGGIVLKVITVSSDVKAAMLYASISGDEQKNSRFFFTFTGNPLNATELTASEAAFRAMSPASYYRNISAAVAIYHGDADTTVPIEWAQETCQQLKDAGVTVQCTYYPGAEHTFRSRYMGEFGPSVSTFFQTYLRK